MNEEQRRRLEQLKAKFETGSVKNIPSEEEAPSKVPGQSNLESESGSSFAESAPLSMEESASKPPVLPGPEILPPSTSEEVSSAPILDERPEAEQENIENRNLSEAELSEIRKRHAERWGMESAGSIKKIISKGALDTMGSIFGVRAAWEVPKAVKGFFDKEKQRKEVSSATHDLLSEMSRIKKRNEFAKQAEGGVSYGESIGSGEVAARIREFNEKLKEVKLPSKEKAELRGEMAGILKEYRNSKEQLSNSFEYNIGLLLDIYVNNDTQTMVAVRESINTVSVMAMCPWLRTVGYGISAGMERYIKAIGEYEKKHYKEEYINDKEKLSFVAKDVFIDSAKETFHGITFNILNKEKKTKIKKTAELVGSFGKLMRVAGLAEFAVAYDQGTLTMQEGAKEFYKALSGGEFLDALKQGGENWWMNAQRLLSYVGISENPEEAMRKLVAGKKAEAVAALAVQERAAVAELGELKELGTIKKGEGITHAILRQLEQDPSAHGFHGDINNKVELHRWAQHEAYDLAVKNNYINSETGEQIRVKFDENNPSIYLLNKDGRIEVENAHEYSWNPAEDIKAELELARLKEVELAAELRGVHETHDSIKRIYKLWPFGNRNEEWEVSRNLKMTDVMRGEFGSPVGGHLDATEKLNREELQEYLRQLKEKTQLSFENDELVKDYLMRANKALVFKIEDEIIGPSMPIGQAAKEAIEQAGSAEIPHTYNMNDELETLPFAGSLVKPHTEIFTFSKDTKAIFEYNQNNQVINCKFNWPKSGYAEGYKILKDNFFEIIQKKNKSSLDLDSAQKVIAIEATRLAYLKKILDKLVGADRDTERMFLRTAIADRITGLEKQYGNVFRK